MLKSQEAELLKSLGFVQKARQLFESQNGSGSAAPRPRSRSRKASTAKPAAKKSKPVSAKPVSAKPAKKSASAGKETRLSKIIGAMKQKNAPISSGDLIQTLFKNQKEDKSFPHFRQLVYTTLTQAFKRGIIKRKGDKLQLA